MERVYFLNFYSLNSVQKIKSYMLTLSGRESFEFHDYASGRNYFRTAGDARSVNYYFYYSSSYYTSFMVVMMKVYCWAIPEVRPARVKYKGIKL